MYMTKREQEMEKAEDQGYRDFNDRVCFDDSVYGDKSLKAAYAIGWNKAKSDYNAFYM